MTYIDTLGQQAKVAGRQIAKLSTAAKNDLLNQVAKALVAESYPSKPFVKYHLYFVVAH